MDCMYRTTWAKSARASKTYRWHVSHCTRKASVQSKRDGLWRKRSERNPSNQYMLEDPRFKLAIKTRVARQGGRDVWQRTYSRLSPFSKWAVRACMHDVERVETRPFHTHAMWTCMVDVGRVPYHASCLASWRGWCSTLPIKTCWRNAGSSFS